MFSPETVKNLKLPAAPGSYQFYGAAGQILYIGKAANLHSRVASYWRESTDHSPAKQKLIGLVTKIKWIETDTEIEALLLEANLIKKYHPPYNIMLRDDKRYSYIKISTEDDFPRIFLTRSLDKSGRYFGPFTSTEAVKEVLKIIRRLWPYRSCRTLPKKACLYYRIGKCPGPCVSAIGRVDYQKTIREITLFLAGEKKKIIKNHELRITNYEKKLLAAESGQAENREKLEQEIQTLKFQLAKINQVLAGTRLVGVGEKYAADVVELAKTLGLAKVPRRIEGYDISNLFGRSAVGSMVVFANGEPDKAEYRKFKIKNSSLIPETTSLDQSLQNLTPPLAPPLIRGGVGERFLKNGDVQMLQEVLERRFKHSSENNSASSLFTGRQTADKISNYEAWPLPDLLVIDGGKAQLQVAERVLKKYQLNIPLVAISKGEGLRSAQAPDKLFFPGEKKALELPLASPALHLIKRVRDESHRFAVSYHKVLRKKKFFGK